MQLGDGSWQQQLVTCRPTMLHLQQRQWAAATGRAAAVPSDLYRSAWWSCGNTITIHSSCKDMLDRGPL